MPEEKKESEQFFGCLNSAGRGCAIVVIGLVVLFVAAMIIGQCQ